MFGNRGIDILAPELNSAAGMADTCLYNGFMQNKSNVRKELTKCFEIAVQNIAPGETVKYVFAGLFDYHSISKHTGMTAFAVTNYRIMIARMSGREQKFLQTTLTSPPTITKGKLFGSITLKIAGQTVPIGINLAKADEVFKILMETVYNETVKLKK